MTFRSLDWSAFQQIRQLLAERTHARFTYDNGVLEITLPMEGHERFALVEKADLYQFLGTTLTDEVAAEIEFRQWVRTHAS